MEAQAGNVTNTSYVVDAKDRVYLVEVVSGNDTSEDIKKRLDDMTATFEVTQLPDGTEEIAEDLADNPSEAADNTLTGEFVGWADGHTVEVKVNGNPVSYIVEDENVKEILGNFDERTLFTFEVDTEGEVQKISKVIGE